MREDVNKNSKQRAHSRASNLSVFLRENHSDKLYAYDSYSDSSLDNRNAFERKRVGNYAMVLCQNSFPTNVWLASDKWRIRKKRC